MYTPVGYVKFNIIYREGKSLKQYNVGILLFDNVDALDFIGPYEVFNMATFKDSDVNKLFLNKLSSEEKPFNVSTISAEGEEVVVHNGLKVLPDYSFKTAPSFDLVVVPGGPYKAIKQVRSNKEIINWIANNNSKMIVSVCTGALFLAEAGLLHGKKATTNRAALELLRSSFPEVEVVSGQKFVDQGEIITSAGVSAGINMAIHVVGKLLDEDASRRVASTIEFD